MAVRMETGKKIDTYVAQLQSPERAHVESIDRTLGRELAKPLLQSRLDRGDEAEAATTVRAVTCRV